MNAAPLNARQYLAYGLHIASDLPIPELESVSSCSSSPDIHVRFLGGRSEYPEDLCWVFRCELDTGQLAWRCARMPEGYLVRFPDLADFSIGLDGRDITCCATTLDSGDDTLRHLLLDQVMPLTIKLQGREALHATAVLTPHGVCAFIGPSGSGKSTIAAAFINSGHPVLCDDCLVLSPEDPVRMVPGYPGVRLWSDAFSALANGDDSLTPLASSTRKRRWAHGLGRELFSPDYRPLKRIYRLMWPPAEHHTSPRPLEPVPAREAFMELVAATFRLDITDRSALAREFLVCERVTRSVPMRRLWLTDDLFSETAREAVLEDVRGEPEDHFGGTS
jgi:hypothetical protein